MLNWIYSYLVGPNIDTGARTISILAFCLSLAGFVFQRLDTRYERQQIRKARLPIINVGLDKNKAPRLWTIEFSFNNRANVPIEIANIEIVSPDNLFIYQIKKTARGTRVRNEATRSRRLCPEMKPIAAEDEEEWRGILAPADQNVAIDQHEDLELIIDVLFQDHVQSSDKIRINRPLWPVEPL
jgi:hypothetical protein